MSWRFSSITLTGTMRCEVASGMEILAFMFFAMAPAAPRKGCNSSLAVRSVEGAWGVRGTAWSPVVGAGAGVAGAAGVGATATAGLVIPLVASEDLGAPLV